MRVRGRTQPYEMVGGAQVEGQQDAPVAGIGNHVGSHRRENPGDFIIRSAGIFYCLAEDRF